MMSNYGNEKLYKRSAFFCSRRKKIYLMTEFLCRIVFVPLSNLFSEEILVLHQIQPPCQTYRFDEL
jgi:hypothetical protein